MVFCVLAEFWENYPGKFDVFLWYFFLLENCMCSCTIFGSPTKFMGSCIILVLLENLCSWSIFKKSCFWKKRTDILAKKLTGCFCFYYVVTIHFVVVRHGSNYWESFNRVIGRSWNRICRLWYKNMMFLADIKATLLRRCFNVLMSIQRPYEVDFVHWVSICEIFIAWLFSFI